MTLTLDQKQVLGVVYAGRSISARTINAYVNMGRVRVKNALIALRAFGCIKNDYTHAGIETCLRYQIA